MRILLLFIFILLIIGCSPIGGTHTPQFKEGEVVCHKAGGPIGIAVRSMGGNTQWLIRFYNKPLSKSHHNIEIAVGGNGLIVGGKAMTGKQQQGFYAEWFSDVELLHEKDCEDRR